MRSFPMPTGGADAYTAVQTLVVCGGGGTAAAATDHPPCACSGQRKCPVHILPCTQLSVPRAHWKGTPPGGPGPPRPRLHRLSRPHPRLHGCTCRAKLWGAAMRMASLDQDFVIQGLEDVRTTRCMRLCITYRGTEALRYRRSTCCPPPPCRAASRPPRVEGDTRYTSCILIAGCAAHAMSSCAGLTSWRDPAGMPQAAPIHARPGQRPPPLGWPAHAPVPVPAPAPAPAAGPGNRAHSGLALWCAGRRCCSEQGRTVQGACCSGQ